MKSKKTSKKFMDYDYINKLSPEERDWLKNFSASFYGLPSSEKTNPIFKQTDQETRRALWRDDHARRRDIWNNGIRIGLNELPLYREEHGEEKEDS